MGKPYKVYASHQRLRSFALLEWAKPYAEQVYRRDKKQSSVEVWLWVKDDNYGHYKTVAYYDGNGWHKWEKED